MDSNVIDHAELALIRSSLRHALDTYEPSTVIDALLREGWAELCEAAPAQALTALAEQAGAARSAAPVADLAVLWGAGVAPDPVTAVLHDGLALAGAERAETFVLITSDGVANVPSSAITLTAVRGLDPTLGLSRATVDRDAGTLIGGSAEAARAVAAGRRAVSSQMVGAAEQMLADTLAYVTERHQYGRSIGSFQTVKHRLADVKVAFTAARSATRAAWEVADTVDGPLTAMAAKVLAGRAQQIASTHCFQVHGGIAFTVEHGFQRWVRRGMVLDRLLGDTDHLTREIGCQLIDAGQVPRVPQLF
jgi:alkylation response protein AidB-like acyl-CoA dehydrogenase